MALERDKSRLLALEDRLVEDELYRIVWDEIERSEIDRAAQARSIEEGAGDKAKTQSAYIKHRIRRLRDELQLHRQKAAQDATPQGSGAKKIPKCSFCGDKLGFFMKNAKLCSRCSNKVVKTAR
jgi:hypothetical protein